MKKFSFFMLFDGFSACVSCEIHVSPPTFYFSEPMMSWGNIKYVSMFSIFVFMNLQEKYLSQSLW